MKAKQKQLLRSIPSVSALLEHEDVVGWLSGLPRALVVRAIQQAVDESRKNVMAGTQVEPLDGENIITRAEQLLAQQATPSLGPVINATGVILHTGLGRSPLPNEAVEAVVEIASGYCNLEFDLNSGERGRRTHHVGELLSSITGGEWATVVNNNAAATLMILQTLAADREVIVSRGQLIEIGGSFRLPDIMAAGGARLREVGTTNRTRIADYERAIGDRTAILLRVHTSNYRIVGFAEETPMGSIAELAHRYGLLAVDDLGSGALPDLAAYGLGGEPRVAASLNAGADLVCFSGDKLLGGPQCGIIAGRRELIERIEASPWMRAFRVGKLTLAALDATLRCHLDAEDAMRRIPTLAMLRADTELLARRAESLLEQLRHVLPDEHFIICSDVSYAGGGALPTEELETVVVQWRPTNRSVSELATALRTGDVPVIARIRDGSICLDLRTIRDSDLEDLVSTVQAAAWSEPRSDDEPGRAGSSLSILD